LSGLTAGLVAGILASTASAGPAFTQHLKVPAAAEFFGSTCSIAFEEEAPPPSSDLTCEFFYVLYFRESEPSSLRDAPWGLYVQHFADVLHPDGTGDNLFFADGLIDDPQGSFDLKHYTSAAVQGIVPLSDGEEIAVDLAWDMAAAELQHGGNNSAFNIFNEIDRHFADRCHTLNQLAHQQYRSGEPGQISGSIDGVNVDDLFRPSGEPFIAGRSVFTYVDVAHGGCETP
jgi:hypothetical protein